MLTPDDIRQIVQNTEVVRPPKQLLATFGTTVVQYFVVTQPSYEGLPGADVEREAVVRSGKVTAQRPEIVTPYYLMNLFRGFDHGQEFAHYLASQYGPGAAGLMYRYEQEAGDTEVVSEPAQSVAMRIAGRLDKEGVHLAAVIRGVDQFWDVSLAQFIYALTAGSAMANAAEMGQRGMLDPDRGLPRGVRGRIEGMFASVARGDLDGSELKTELDRWGVFDEYEDRFLSLYRR
ncbi:MAG TPA: hypothetical protein VFS62_01560 [Chloroflexota bacterium]|nr:hypothetical protein [Chloroflexota bacterium]